MLGQKKRCLKWFNFWVKTQSQELQCLCTRSFPSSSDCVITSECGGDDEGLWQWGYCTRWHRNQKRTYRGNADPEDKKANRGLLGALPMWMKVHFTENFCVFYTSGADRSHENNSVLNRPQALTTKFSRRQPWTFRKDLQMLWFLFVFYTISSSLSLLLWLVKPKPLIKYQIKNKGTLKKHLCSCIWTKLTFHIHS